MNTFDILIYAAIAAFLASRLWSVLGQKDDEDEPLLPRVNPPPLEKRGSSEDEDAVIILEGRTKPPPSEVLTQAGHAKTSLAGRIDEIKTLDPSFDERRFLEGARWAFQEIVKAFAAGDLSPVARFLGPQVLSPFQEAIKVRKETGKKLDNKIERIAATDIVAARLDGTTAFLTVEFISHQINTLLDEQEPLPRESRRAEEVRDRWIFRRDVAADDPNWLLVETLS